MKYPMAHKVKRPFLWTSAAATDVRATIRREQRRLAAISEAQRLADEEAKRVVAPIRKGALK